MESTLARCRIQSIWRQLSHLQSQDLQVLQLVNDFFRLKSNLIGLFVRAASIQGTILTKFEIKRTENSLLQFKANLSKQSSCRGIALCTDKDCPSNLFLLFIVIFSMFQHRRPFISFSVNINLEMRACCEGSKIIDSRLHNSFTLHCMRRPHWGLICQRSRIQY